MLSYDVETGVSWAELRRRLEEETLIVAEEETLIVAEDQLLLTWNGDLLAHTGPTAPSRDAPSSNVVDSHRRHGSSECVGVVVGPACLAEDVWVPRPAVPAAVERVLKDPDRRWDYCALRKIHAASVHFLRTQKDALKLMFDSRTALRCVLPWKTITSALSSII